MVYLLPFFSLILHVIHRTEGSRLSRPKHGPAEFTVHTWDIIGLSETHINKCGETTTEEGRGFWFSGDGGRQQHGVGVIVNRTKDA